MRKTKERNTTSRESFTPESSLQHNASRIDELVGALGKVLFFASDTATRLGIQKQIAGGKLGLLPTLIEDAVRCIEAHAFGEPVPTNFKQLIGQAIDSANTQAAQEAASTAVSARRSRQAASASLIQ